MPFRFPWPFGRPRRERKPPRAPAPTTAANPDSPAPVQFTHDRTTEPPLVPQPALETARESDLPLAPDGPDLGQELLARMPALSTPPILGRLGGLPAMAQTLPTVDRFLKNLPAPPPSPALPGMGEAADFAANLPSLAGFTEPGRAEQRPAFPAQLEPPREPTDVLAPPGGMPGQVASLSGAAAVLEPSRPPAIQPIVVPTPPSAATQPALPTAQVQRAIQVASAPATALVVPVSGPAAPTPSTAGFQTAPARSQPLPPMTRVLSPEQTLTGNVLPPETFAPIQREVRQATDDELALPAEFTRPAEQHGERVSTEQRDNIESQRGQGRPLEPEVRQHFEQAYGQPLDEVRIHTGPAAHATAQSLNAIAFASGSDLFFTQNTYEPASPQGLALIGHELAHVIQQDFGVAGEADELRSPDDRYEREADQFAARAVGESWLHAPATAEAQSNAALPQRVSEDELRVPGSSLTLPAAATWAPGQRLRATSDMDKLAQPLATPLPLASRRPEDEPIRRFAAAATGSPASTPASVPINSAMGTNSVISALPSLERAPERAAGLTEQFASPAWVLSNPINLSHDLPGLGRVEDAGQWLPVLRSISRGLPGLSSLSDLGQNLPSLGSATPSAPNASASSDSMPGMPSISNLPASLPGLGSGAPAMPDLGGVAQGLGSQLTPFPQMPGPPPGLPSLAGLNPPAMPLAEGMTAASQAAPEAMAAGQRALGSITGMEPGGGGSDTPAAPALPSLEKLTEHIWKEVQRKLKVERERSRGLA